MENQEYSLFIRDAAKWGHDVLRVFEHVDLSAISDLAENARRSATRLTKEAISPVKLGVVGEFSSGKSLVIGALVGFGDLLPVSDAPTTGNVTALRILQASDGESPGLQGDVVIEYLNREAAAECMQFLLTEAAERSQAAQLSEAPEQFRQLKMRVHALDIHHQIEAIVRTVWNVSKNPSLRFLLRELISFVRADAAFKDLKGHDWVVSPEIARIGLQLPRQKVDIQTQTYETLPPPPAKLVKKPAQFEMTSELLGASFPLIQRCTQTIRVPRRVWDLDAIRGTNEFILLDFPGLGAENSGVRDRYLCFRELKDVQSILVLLNGQRSGSGGATELYTMMQSERDDLKHCFLVGIGRFDQIPIDSAVQESLLDRCAASQNKPVISSLLTPPSKISSPPLRDSDVIDAIAVLDGLIQSAFAFTNDRQRIAFLSPMLGLHAISQQSNHPPCSPEFQTRLADAVQPAQRTAQFWGKIGRTLQDNKGSDLTDWLTSFETDGGMSLLRTMIQSHVAEHGMRQLHDRVRKLGKDTRVALRNCVDELKRKQSQPQPHSPLLQLQNGLIGLIGQYNELKQDYESRPPTLVVRVENQEPLRNIEAIVHDFIVKSVMEWPEWARLLNAVRNSYVVPPQSHTNGGLLPQIQKEQHKTPTYARDFKPSFAKTCEQTQEFVKLLAKSALSRWFEDLGDKIAEKTDLIRSYLDERENTTHPEHLQEHLAVLQYAIEPHRLLPRLLNVCFGSGGSSDTADRNSNSSENVWSRSAFPLTMDREFAWHPDIVNRPEEISFPMQSRHQVQLQRLMQKFIASISREFTAQLALVSKQSVAVLRETFEQIEEQLRSMQLKPELVQWLAGIDASPNENEEPDELSTKFNRLISDAPPGIR